MSKPDFVYVTYISSTPEKVWDALTNAELTKQYWWNHNNASDWKPGSEWKHQDYDDPSIVHVVGKIVESDRPKRLVITWAAPADAGDESQSSLVTFEIEPYMDAVRLQVTHDRLPSPKALADISKGWPAVLSSLKTLLETGNTLAMARKGCPPPPR
jgi:uncharacterized protein YndB with AHSA1/START domain